MKGESTEGLRDKDVEGGVTGKSCMFEKELER